MKQFLNKMRWRVASNVLSGLVIFTVLGVDIFWWLRK